MKNILSLILLVCVLSVFVLAQEPEPTPTTPQVDQNLIKDIREVKDLARELIGKENQTQQSQQEQPKTMADVLDKGVDLFAGYVSAVSEMIKKIAPELWRIMIRQQYAKAIMDPLFDLGLLIILWVWFRLVKRFSRPKDVDKKDYDYRFSFDSDSEGAWTIFGMIIPMCAAFIFGIIFFYDLSISIGIFINPEYYAIKDILEMIAK